MIFRADTGADASSSENKPHSGSESEPPHLRPHENTGLLRLGLLRNTVCVPGDSAAESAAQMDRSNFLRPRNRPVSLPVPNY